MLPVHEFIPAALAAILRRAPLTPEKVAFAWRSAVGASVDRATTIELRDDVLHVTARDRAWQREVERSAALIRARLETFLGEGVVRRVAVTGPAGAESTATRSGSGSAAAASARSAGPSGSATGSGRRRR